MFDVLPNRSSSYKFATVWWDYNLSMLLSRVITSSLKLKPHYVSTGWSFCSKAFSSVLDEENKLVTTNYSSNLHLSPLFPDAKPHFSGYDIELMDDSAWQLSSGLARAWQKTEEAVTRTSSLPEEGVDDLGDCNSDSVLDEGDPDFDDIDNMRIRGSLFYKIDRDSKEFEEYSFDFHRRKKPSKKKDDPKESKKKQSDSKGQRDNRSSSKKKDDLEESKRKQNRSDEAQRNNPSRNLASISEKLPKLVKNKSGLMSTLDETDSTSVGQKKVRTPTFNQLTAPYHEPFCLDIFISKASVRACIVHRMTSKVVAVAHSISKDMKFDLASTRNSTACSAVGSVLAQRALADDIHDVVYTPRKGERLEGKLQLVLQSVIDNGINVKVKIKQKKYKKLGPPTYSL